MSGFIRGISRSQATLFPERIDDYISEDNTVRIIDAFVDSLSLTDLTFKTEPAITGRPGYHPSTMLKLYIYGYLNRIQSTRRLESEAQRNVELMWLLERLTPDFKTIADFRRDNGKGIQQVCRQFVMVCRKLNLLSDVVAIDGSKFKAVNSQENNFTPNRIRLMLKQLDKNIHHYLLDLANSDKQDSDEVAESNKASLEHKINQLKQEVAYLKSMEQRLADHPDKQISKTDPDSRAMKSRNRGFVGYNVQSAVDTKSHIIVTHEVTNRPTDRGALAQTAQAAKQELQTTSLKVLADRGYYSGVEMLACESQGIETYIPKSLTSNNRSKGLFDKADFIWIEQDQEYLCPAGNRLPYHTSTTDKGKIIYKYWTSACGHCHLKEKCTKGKEWRVSRWEHEDVVERAQKRLVENPMMMTIRQSTVEHPFGTIKDWMGHTHFKMKRLKHVSTEMSLHVLCYNIKRVIRLMGPKQLIAAIAG